MTDEAGAIDLESPGISLAYVRQIRQSIEQDVLNLQNRVRMLQEEEQRTLKVIRQTELKTEKLRAIIKQNDLES